MASRPVHLMIVGAHPADVFDQAGGTLAHHIEQGDRVTALIVSTGSRSHDWQNIDEKIRRGGDLDYEQMVAASREKKLAEVQRGCAILGITDIRTLDHDDDMEMLTQELVIEIGEQIREVKPDILITHHPHEDGGYKLHGSVGQAVLYAYRYADGAGRTKTQPHRVRSIYLMNPLVVDHGAGLGSLGTGRVDLFVDITDVIDKKIRAMDCIASQYYGGPYSRKRAEVEDGGMGYHAEVPYAEAFQRFFPWVCYTLPISDFELHKMEETSEETMVRRSCLLAHQVPLPPDSEWPEYSIDKDLYNY